MVSHISMATHPVNIEVTEAAKKSLMADCSSNVATYEQISVTKLSEKSFPIGAFQNYFRREKLVQKVAGKFKDPIL